MNISLIKSTCRIACKLFTLCSDLNDPEWPTEGTKRVTCTSMYLIGKNMYLGKNKVFILSMLQVLCSTASTF
jgi:hypothetical protein